MGFCPYPIQIEHPSITANNGNFVEGLDSPTVLVPCGKCIYCQRARRKEWTFRLTQELLHHQNCFHVTLTLAPEHIDSVTSDPHAHFRRFFDRIRSLTGKAPRHFIVAEYGEELGRLHFHLLLIDTPDILRCSPEFTRKTKHLRKYFKINDLRKRPLGEQFTLRQHVLAERRGDYRPHTHLDVYLFKQLWAYGQVYVREITNRTAGYLSKYVTADLSTYGVPPIRVYASAGLGTSYLTASRLAWHRGCLPTENITPQGINQQVIINDRCYSLPRYLFLHIFDDLDRKKISFWARDGEFPRTLNGHTYCDPLAYLVAFREQLKTRGEYSDIRNREKQRILTDRREAVDQKIQKIHENRQREQQHLRFTYGSAPAPRTC